MTQFTAIEEPRETARVPRFLLILRELESNMFAILLLTFAFLLTLAVIAVIASALGYLDIQAVLGLAGMGSGTAVSSSVNQTLSNRSPNYSPLVATPTVAPLPIIPSEPTVGPPSIALPR